MARIFISYKRADYDVVYTIKQRIESSLQTECWMDLEGISSIQQFPVEICNAISQCDVFLFMYSKEHLKITDFDNDWTLKELSFASAEKKKIVLVHIDDAKLKGVFSFNYSTYNNIDARVEIQFNKLLNDIRLWLSLPSNYNGYKQNAFKNVNGYKQSSSKNIGVVPKNPTAKYPGVVIENGVLKKVPQDISGNFIIREDVKSIGKMAFSGCRGLTNVTIPNSVTRIDEFAFYNCIGMTSMIIPNSVTSIGKCAFCGCKSLTIVTIPNSVRNIGEGVFCQCLCLAQITMPYSVTNIGKSAFDGCEGLTHVTIPNSVTSIGADAFYRCKGLTHVTIPDSIISVGKSAFGECTGLTQVEIPNSVKSIGRDAFNHCNRLRSVSLSNVMIEIEEDAFRFCDNLTAIFVPMGTKNRFQVKFPSYLRRLIIEK